MTPIILPYHLLSVSAVFVENEHMPTIVNSRPSHWEFNMPEVKAYLSDHNLTNTTHLAINDDNRMTLVFHNDADAVIFKLKML